ncbi:MAG: inositol monophosphatase [Planctomycetaceae bacterium]|nr:inositol monophosphatase [Planctomycetaceae bacterium]
MPSEFLTVAEAAARRGGEVLQQWAQKFTVTEKSPKNLVTEADLASEKAIHETIEAAFPSHGFLGEEGLSVPADGCDYRWVIDPLDGTSNYVHHFPYYCVSIALQNGDELVAAVIYDPNQEELFTAEKGSGAFVNGKPLQTTRTDVLKECMVVASLPVNVTREHPAVQSFLDVMPAVQHIQRTGSAALNLAYVAGGRIDAYWSTTVKPWDMAAGALIVAEAGGRVTRCDCEPLDIEVPDILATNGTEIHAPLSELLSGE